MRKFFVKIITTPNNVAKVNAIAADQTEIASDGRHVQKHVKRLFKGSLAIRQVDAGSDNAAEQELTALTNNYYDIGRFGIHFVASPRHADMLMVTGPVTRNMEEALRRTYDATPNPKIVVAVGDDAIDGGIFKDSYATVGGVNKIIPVDYQIPGDPPSPMAILRGLLEILEIIDKSKGGQ